MGQPFPGPPIMSRPSPEWGHPRNPPAWIKDRRGSILYQDHAREDEQIKIQLKDSYIPYQQWRLLWLSLPVQHYPLHCCSLLSLCLSLTPTADPRLYSILGLEKQDHFPHTSDMIGLHEVVIVRQKKRELSFRCTRFV